MPFTAFHFGPGAAIKALAPRQFSMSVFCFTQVVIDGELLVHMARNEERLHQHLHTCLGALGVTALGLIVGRPICQGMLRWWSNQPNLPLIYKFSPAITMTQAITGAVLGTFTHVFLDAIMHSDARPWAPWSVANQLYGFVGPGSLHLLCFLLGVFGIWLCHRRSNEL